MASGVDVRNLVRKDDESSRGKYSPVTGASSGLKHRSLPSQRLVQLLPLAALLVGGAILMVVHHVFYSHLNEMSINETAAELPSFLRNQRNVNFIGTAIAHGARILLSAAIGVTFTQLFWQTLRSRSHSIAQIDALVSCGQSPFHPSAFRAATASFALFLISLIASTTALIVVLSPGSLTISTNFQRTKPCTVPTVPPEVMTPNFDFQDDSFGIALAQQAVMASIPTSNSYLPPFRNGSASTCGEDTSACTYDLSFVGPALDCVDVTDQTNFTFFLNPDDAPAAQPFTIWNSTFNDGPAVGITILSRDLLKDLLQATNCTAYNATYDVVVSLVDGSASVEVHGINRGSVLLQDSSFLSFYGQSAVGLLKGIGFAGPNAPLYGGIYSGSFFETTPNGSQTFSDTVPHFSISLVQNVSISLLSGNVYYGISNDTATNLRSTDTTCSSSVNVYIYNSTRLLATYGVILGVATLIVAYGCSLILRNDMEQKVVFSEVMKIALNEDMFFIGGDIHEKAQTRVHLIRTNPAMRKLIPTAPVDDINDSRTSLELSKELGQRRSFAIGSFRSHSNFLRSFKDGDSRSGVSGLHGTESRVLSLPGRKRT
ncbi:hypothetical protein SCHPADRAFT_652102 [Schizopora paradoxa]|uniref:Uncharacterized protein n=1 Tax=Schizopora paradoxa TaxID=27342 RepID=A0A0H2RRA3_9AGAM|nr:hypothetical protein SCHPADRAFT_652102 [Schizopora paradoxa]